MGYRNGAYNFNYFAPGVVNPVAGSTNGSGRFPGSGLHIPSSRRSKIQRFRRGAITLLREALISQRISIRPIRFDDLVSFFEHIINDVILRRGHGC